MSNTTNNITKNAKVAKNAAKATTMNVKDAMEYLASQGFDVTSLYGQKPIASDNSTSAQQQQSQTASTQMPGPVPVVNNAITAEALNTALLSFGQTILEQSAHQMQEMFKQWKNEHGTVSESEEESDEPVDGEEISADVSKDIAKTIKNRKLSSIYEIVKKAASGLTDRFDNRKKSTDELVKWVHDKYPTALTVIENQLKALAEIEIAGDAPRDQILLARKQIAALLRDMRTLLTLVIHCINNGTRLSTEKNSTQIVYIHDKKWDITKWDNIILPKYYGLNDTIKRNDLYDIYDRCHNCLSLAIKDANQVLLKGIALESDTEAVNDDDIKDFKTTMSNIDKISTTRHTHNTFEKIRENFKKENLKEVAIVIGAGILITGLIVLAVVIANGGFDEYVSNDVTATVNNTTASEMWGSFDVPASAYGY